MKGVARTLRTATGVLGEAVVSSVLTLVQILSNVQVQLELLGVEIVGPGLEGDRCCQE